MEFLYNSDIAVGISFVLFFGLLGYLGVHKMIGKMLDDRADKIREDLAEANRLKEEAQQLYAEFERKQKEVEGQAEEIISKAKAEAEAAAARAKEDLKVSIERRLKAADEQIAQAEASAVKDVKDKAVSVAVAAAADILRERLAGESSQGLVDSAIADLGKRLH